MSKLVAINGTGGKTTFSLLLNKYYNLQKVNTKLIHLDSIVCEVAMDCDAGIDPAIHLGKFYNQNADLVTQLATPKIKALLDNNINIYVIEGVYNRLISICRREISPEGYISVNINNNEITIDGEHTKCNLFFDHPNERNVTILSEYISENVDAANYFEQLRIQSNTINKLLC